MQHVKTSSAPKFYLQAFACLVFFFYERSCFNYSCFRPFSPLQTDVPIPQFQHHWTQPHGPLQRLCGSCFG